jgi:hypothetical protein
MNRKTRYFMAGSAAILAAGLCTGLIAAFSGGGLPSLSASLTGPPELSYIPADATVVAYANVGEVMASEIRQKMKRMMPGEEGQKEFQQQTGIDIEQDIRYVVAAMTSGAPANANGLVVARGNFNPTQLETLAREHGGVVEEYRGKRLVTVSHEGRERIEAERPDTEDAPAVGAVTRHRAGNHRMTLAFLESDLIAIGSEAAIKSSIDAQLTARSITSNKEMMELVSDIERGNNAWAVGRFDAIASEARIPTEIRNRLPAVKTFAVMSHIDGGVAGTLRAEARDDEAAENLRQVVQGFLALGRMQAQADPKVAGLLNSLQLSGSGRTVALSFAVPAEVFDLIPKYKAMDGEAPHELHDLKPAPWAPAPPAPPAPPRPDK